MLPPGAQAQLCAALRVLEKIEEAVMVEPEVQRAIEAEAAGRR